MPERAKRAAWWSFVALAIAAIVFVAATYLPKTPAAQTLASPPASAAAADIGCMGRIEPEDGVIHVNAPYVEGAPAVVAELRVAENGQVSKSQLIAVLRGSERVEAGVREAGARVEAARKKVAQSREGPKTADVATREAEIGRLETELAHGRDELVRYQKLRQTDDVTESELAARRNTVAVAERALEESRQKLRSLNSTSTGAIEVAEAELKVAIAAEARVVADRAGTLVLAPAAGRVLKIHAHAGEQIGPDGLLELAKTARMYVVAEVHEGDARRVRAGQTASITGEMFAGELAGIVERIGSAIARSQLFPADPVAFADTRVVPVYIRLKDAGTAANLIHGKVSVVIRP